MRRFLCAIAIVGIALVPCASPVWAGPQKPAAAAQTDGSSSPRAASAGRAVKARATAAAPVNLNSATAAQLQTLPGIGASSAQRILDFRQKNGAFKKVEELMKTPRLDP
ncbi:MAG: helix-hairpin-helix domain-containing protein [Acidobacteriota bacterium]